MSGLLPGVCSSAGAGAAAGACPGAASAVPGPPHRWNRAARRPRGARQPPAQSMRASAQTAGTSAPDGRDASATRRIAERPVTSTRTGTAESRPSTTGDRHSRTPSAHTEKRAAPSPPDTSSIPASAWYVEHSRFRSMVTEDLECTVMPCPYVVPPTVGPCRRHTQPDPPSRSSGPVWSPNTSYSSRATRYVTGSGAGAGSGAGVRTGGGTGTGAGSGTGAGTETGDAFAGAGAGAGPAASAPALAGTAARTGTGTGTGSGSVPGTDAGTGPVRGGGGGWGADDHGCGSTGGDTTDRAAGGRAPGPGTGPRPPVSIHPRPAAATASNTTASPAFAGAPAPPRGGGARGDRRARRTGGAPGNGSPRPEGVPGGDPADDRDRQQHGEAAAGPRQLPDRRAAPRAALQVPAQSPPGPARQPTARVRAEPVGVPGADAARRQGPVDVRLEARPPEPLAGPVRQSGRGTGGQPEQRRDLVRRLLLDDRVPQHRLPPLRQRPERPHGRRPLGLPHGPHVRTRLRGAPAGRLRRPRGLRSEHPEALDETLPPDGPRPARGRLPDGRQQIRPHGPLRARTAAERLPGPREHLGRQVVGRVPVPAARARVPPHRFRVAPEQLPVRRVVVLAQPPDQLRVGRRRLHRRPAATRDGVRGPGRPDASPSRHGARPVLPERAPERPPAAPGRGPGRRPPAGRSDRTAAERSTATLTVQRDRPRTPPQTGTPAQSATAPPDGRHHGTVHHPSGEEPSYKRSHGHVPGAGFPVTDASGAPPA